MNSRANRSELALGRLAAEAIAGRAAPRVLVGGLGMGCTLRACLDALPPAARVLVAELHEVVAEWCRIGPLAALTAGAALDPRVTVRIGDVAAPIAEAARPGGERLDAIVLDLYEGPRPVVARGHPHYGPAALARARDALRPGGVLAVWLEEPTPSFTRSLERTGFAVRSERAGEGGRRHAVVLATRPAGRPGRGGSGGAVRSEADASDASRPRGLASSKRALAERRDLGERGGVRVGDAAVALASIESEALEELVVRRAGSRHDHGFPARRRFIRSSSQVAAGSCRECSWIVAWRSSFASTRIAGAARLPPARALSSRWPPRGGRDRGARPRSPGGVAAGASGRPACAVAARTAGRSRRPRTDARPLLFALEKALVVLVERRGVAPHATSGLPRAMMPGASRHDLTIAITRSPAVSSSCRDPPA